MYYTFRVVKMQTCQQCVEIFKETRQQKSGSLDDESNDKLVIQPAYLITILSLFKVSTTSWSEVYLFLILYFFNFVPI